MNIFLPVGQGHKHFDLKHMLQLLYHLKKKRSSLSQQGPVPCTYFSVVSISPSIHLFTDPLTHHPPIIFPLNHQFTHLSIHSFPPCWPFTYPPYSSIHLPIQLITHLLATKTLELSCTFNTSNITPGPLDKLPSWRSLPVGGGAPWYWLYWVGGAPAYGGG